MQVLVDTCIWSLALRRHSDNSPEVNELKELITEQRVNIMGSIRQEILSGVNHKTQFILLKERLAAFPDLLCKTVDYECAAEFSNTARSKGIQGSVTDFLICAVAYRYSLSIYSTDKDFVYFNKHLPIMLHKMR